MGSQSLAERECTACTSEDEPLAGEALAELYEHLDASVWSIVTEHHLEGTFPFDDFRQALDFTVAVGELAEDEWHHPDIHLSWGEVTIEMWTHKIDGLHETDFIMAARMDDIASEIREESN